MKIAALLAAAAWAQDAPPQTSDTGADTEGEAVVVTAKRAYGSAIADIPPVLELDRNALDALGATKISELIQRLGSSTRSFTGEASGILLNGRRVASEQDVYGIPPEAIEKVEVLSERDAARFGFSPTMRVTNFITKKQFRALATQQLAGAATEGGGGTNYTEANSTRIDGNRRLTVTASYLRQNPVFETQRDIAPVIDAARGINLSPYRTLNPLSDKVSLDGTLAAPVSGKIDGSLNVTMEAERTRGLIGLATDPLPTGAPDILRQRTTRLSLHAGGTLQGYVGSWSWNATSSYDRLDRAALSRGDDATVPPIDRSRTTADTVAGKLVASGPVLTLPAGAARVTLSADYGRSNSNGVAFRGTDGFDFARTVRSAAVNATVPIISPDGPALAFAGRLSATGEIGVSDVSGSGQLLRSTYALTWVPRPIVDFNLSVNRTQTPPDIALLNAPVQTTPNVPFFDFVRGQSDLVTTVAGGNPGLDPERRRITTAGIGLNPIKNTSFRLALDYIDTDIRNLTAVPSGATLPIQRAFPDRFVRDASGALVSVDFSSVNIARERERKLRLSTNLFTKLGKSPPPPPAPTPGAKPDAAAPPPRPVKRPPVLFMNASATYRLADAITLRPGLAPLDLLDGATLDGTGGRARWEADGTIGLGYGPVNIGTYSRLQGPTRIRSELPGSDLRFSERTWIVLYSFVDVSKLVKAPWTQKMSLQFTVENLLNDRVDVRAADGRTPTRYQSAYLDPLGRSVRIGVRKLF
ncbi:hypothetical protein GGQ80_002944 [Sphingomonas jinjuensis]|uniref:TonB-dependent receptor n=1 Tax=Sphingomonas jinjuensis TaxID=535907 RepID=A0A840FH74_9SPHN|nr:TonB-dependent receptor [Sphingomonas jinjuensis]MBB4155027.1 hypothetical protein [Sphingomonas jinjuensis]